MENWKRFTQNLFEKLQPLPKAEVEEDKFLNVLSLNALSGKQIREVLRIVIEEARKSRRFGLIVNGHLLEREEAFFLAIINKLGGVGPLTRNYSYEEAYQRIGEVMHQLFAEDEKRFHQSFSEAGDGGANTRYAAHLVSVLSSVLQAAYNGNLSL